MTSSARSRAITDAGPALPLPIEPVDPASAPRDRWRLFLASFLALFLELALIRWIPAYVKVVGYFTNLILIASFLGLGTGFLLSNHRRRLEPWLLPALLAVGVLVWLFRDIVVLNQEGGAEPLWLPPTGNAPASWTGISGVVLVHFIAVTCAAVPVGQVMGRLFGRFPPTAAYSLDLGGSLTGVVLFALLSAAEVPPVAWFALAAVVIVGALLHTTTERAVGAVVAGLLLTLVVGMQEPGEIWSTYYKAHVGERANGRQSLYVNGSLHQVMLDLEDPSEYVQKTLGRFEIPYRAAQALDDVLIVGAGTGNDVAVARRMGAKRIDAVEIDAAFPRLGRALHPAHPYDSPGVTLHITDARAYFKNCERRYDLIVFGTLDSQALLSGLSSVRLDNYVYTAESFREAMRLLKPQGLLAVFHLSIRSYIAQRIIRLLADVGGQPPVVLEFEDHTLFNVLAMQGASLPMPRVSPVAMDELATLDVPTDDWPFLYLRARVVPGHYVEVLAGVVLLALLLTLGAMRSRVRQFNVGTFLLGAGFMLLETKSVTQMALLFGSTWVVNLLVFSSILLVLLLVNVAIQRRWISRGRVPRLDVPFAALVVCLLVLALLPVSWLSGLPEPLRWLLGGLMIAVPMGLAGCLFPTMLASSRDVQAAFGANLLGSIVGGVAEYLCMVVGIGGLGLVGGAFYLGAMLVYLRQRQG